MLRNRQISSQALAAFSRSMARMLEAGVEIRKSLQTSSRQSGDSRLTPSVERVQRSIAGGSSLAESLNEEGDLYPPLFRDLVNVGELTGTAPDVFASLARYYEARVAQVREFRAAIAWPVIQLVAAIGIVGLLIFVLGMLPSQQGGEPFDVIGLGLYGTSGAMTWFTGWLVGAAGLFFVWKFAANNTSGQMLLHPFLLQVPVIGKCMQSFAISRFSWCFALTQQAGMSIRPSLDCSLKATANGAFIAADALIWDELKSGESFTDALTASKLFPLEYLQVVDTAEQTGTIPEQLDRLSHLFDDEARRAMNRLTALFSGAIWLSVVILIIVFIFRIFMIYVGTMQDALKGVNGV
ncbi:MAG TPA: type II secretion system F family protein [Planctomycetaceae bacterium]|mgnify:CR=1 FL=1|nr:type II secretion system F family protein [Planctomycetaceae bacterium]HQZ66906.1 type II secretion system F family protein [Planctomycetaceae bacterium]HRA88480.1 type II secretion system F family protein [Planctomycetaceae bacterium]